MSLKKHLEEEIRKRGKITYADLVEFSRVWGYKVENGSRRLRELVNEVDDIEVVMKKNYIDGWQIKKDQMELVF
jgi:predicted SPOUT superfamily RNA methylase MTH1